MLYWETAAHIHLVSRPPRHLYVFIRPVSGLMVRIVQIHDSFPSHEQTHSQWSNKPHQSPLRGQRWINHEGLPASRLSSARNFFLVRGT